MKKILLADLNDFFKKISENQKLYIPTDNEKGEAYFKPFEDGMELTKKLNTVRSAKDFFFPQVENLVGFKVTGREIETIETRDVAEPFVLFGVRPCDVKSFALLDRVFLAEPVDSYYEERRNAATVISLACNAPEKTCFCSNFGIDPALNNAVKGADVRAFFGEDALYLTADTEKGEKLLAGVGEEVADTSADSVKSAISEKAEAMPLKNLDLSAVGEGKTEELFELPVWEKLSEACLGCGTCTFVCPTCQCYDVQEFNDGHTVRRFRCWDSCMYSDFTQMSAGQPRPTQKERFRQRFMHKLVYFPDRQEGEFGCVGCGRCLKKCPINMNIVKVIRTLGEKKGEEK